MPQPTTRVGRTLAESTPAFDEPARPRTGAPNVVMIVLDDLGFADLGCYGSDIETPHMDRLANHGLRYNNFHVTPVCSASRACLMTGRNHHAVGMGWLANSMTFPGYSARIPKSAGTLPRLLRDAGYNTMAVGKWHLTPHAECSPAGPLDRWPLGMGFERYYGFLDGVTNQWAPDLVRDNTPIEPPATFSDGYHLTEDLADQAIRMVKDQKQAAPDKPFFLYFATGAMHSPHQVPAEWIEPYRGQFDDGWEALRRDSFERQVKLGVAPPDATLTDRPVGVPAWDDLSADERRFVARQMEVYAGFLTHTDAQIGRVLDFLERIDALDNTIVMVTSDNGACPSGGPYGAIRSDDYHKSNDVASMMDHIDDLGGPNTHNSYAWGWAWASNTPFRLWKHFTWLGGVRVPLIAHWPDGIQASQHGQVRSQFSHAIDLMPTILHATDTEAPSMLDGVTQQPVDGASILPTFTDPNLPGSRATQYFEMMGSRAIYHDGWKATTDHLAWGEEFLEGSTNIDTDHWSLFNLTTDFTEAHDLAATEPARLRHMIELWWHEAGRNQVLPLIRGWTERHQYFESPLYPPR